MKKADLSFKVNFFSFEIGEGKIKNQISVIRMANDIMRSQKRHSVHSSGRADKMAFIHVSFHFLHYFV